MLQPSSATVTLGQAFSLSVQVGTQSAPNPETGQSSFTLITSVPSVSTTTVDTGTSYTTSVGQVSISGTPEVIPNTSWRWLDNTGAQLSGPRAPAANTYSKITGVDSPPSLPGTTSYTYTIQGEPFTLTVQMTSYDPVPAKLKSLLATVT